MRFGCEAEKKANMFLLRIFLYFVCVVSIGWGILVFGGPTIIKRLIIGYTSGSVVPSDIQVSPLLNVSIGRLEYSFEMGDVNVPIVGLSRSTEISWSLSNDKPLLNLDFGPTFVKDIAVADNVKIYIPSYRNIDWQNVSFVAETLGLGIPAFGKIDDLILEGRFDRASGELNDLSFDANIVVNNSESNWTWSAGKIDGAIDQLFLNTSFIDQSFLVHFSVLEIKGVDLSYDISRARGFFEVNQGKKNFKIDFDEILLKDLGGSIDEVEINGSYDNENEIENLRVDFSQGTFAKKTPSFSGISTQIVRNADDNYDAYVNGNLHEFELYSAENFLGLLPPSNFIVEVAYNNKASALINEPADLISQIEIVFDDLESFKIDGSAQLELQVERLTDITACASKDCEFSGFDFTYKIDLDDEWVVGRSRCPKNSCSFKTMRHTLTISNTVNILQSLNDARVLNPLSSLYLYSVLTDGQKVNDGHRLEF